MSRTGLGSVQEGVLLLLPLGVEHADVDAVLPPHEVLEVGPPRHLSLELAQLWRVQAAAERRQVDGRARREERAVRLEPLVSGCEDRVEYCLGEVGEVGRGGEGWGETGRSRLQ